MLAPLAYATDDITSDEKTGSAFHFGRRSRQVGVGRQRAAEEEASDGGHAALLRRPRGLGFELGLEDARAQVAEVAGVRPVDDDAPVAQLPTAAGAVVQPSAADVPRDDDVDPTAGTDDGRQDQDVRCRRPAGRPARAGRARTGSRSGRPVSPDRRRPAPRRLRGRPTRARIRGGLVGLGGVDSGDIAGPRAASRRATSAGAVRDESAAGRTRCDRGVDSGPSPDQMEHAFGECHIATLAGRPRGNADGGALSRSTTAQQGGPESGRAGVSAGLASSRWQSRGRAVGCPAWHVRR